LHWLPVVIGLAMFIAGALFLRRASQIVGTDMTRSFERDEGSIIRRIKNLETSLLQMQHSGEIPILGNPDMEKSAFHWEPASAEDRSVTR
jgi:hypothetical protein